MRLVSTPITDTSSKVAAIIGVVPTCAASEMASRFDTVSGGLRSGRNRVGFQQGLNGLSKEQDAEDGGDGKLKARAVDEERVVCQDGGEHSGSYPRNPIPLIRLSSPWGIMR
jgi:hypothetical protein